MATTNTGESDADNNNNNNNNNVPLVLRDLRGFLKRDGRTSSLFDMSVMATPVAAIKALLGVVERSNATTMMELQDELKQAREIIMQDFLRTQTDQPSSVGGGGDDDGDEEHPEIQLSKGRARNTIALASGCDLFLKYATRTFLEHGDFAASRNQVLERGQRFAGISLAARDRIAHVAADFIQEGQTVLTHGWSRVVASILLKAAETKHFDIVILEGRPDAAGAKAARAYATHESQIPTTVVLDSAMGHVMESVDVVLVGAEAVVENGGVVNKMGTYALATCAKAHGKPFYVASESYKFARLYPLNQQDLPVMGTTSPIRFLDTTTPTPKTTTDDELKEQQDSFSSIDLPDNVRVENSPVDFTPAKFITLLFTDLGVLTPSAVSDELIRLYS
mmetsp:Transcript_3525/g.9881  ORF Transcript_3525/g.9881 Transcript_3525/m.9881 type:complete len:392 (-) Transcript_3525:325-1500(-)|eukprot:CAMPEP_0172360010 /NCGR_PEP_ID=MMETSP1060-20121228/4113_1 /TAXON_ID=37318 /ORGANISM="Pseudo-nitzschia pungens, Strain cf. cingulata" /LENGTH=391 /DNA_ID=CAMNT_0013081863 /DNA_START=174 /DNA_END=1349 /DNA_ORIENTATION=+